jgi:hypothetical protein
MRSGISRVSRRLARGAAVGALIGACIDFAAADDTVRFTLLEENDSIWSSSDKYYSQGLGFSLLTGDVAAESGANGPFDLLAGWGLFAADGAWRSRRYEILLGQQIFTPRDTGLDNPDADDRPYAGWFYGGVGLLQDTDRRRLDHFELVVGIAGPTAFGETVQNDWHQYIGIDEAEGWDHQIHDEPGVMISYERKWRFLAPMGNGFGADFIPEAGATLGNIMTYGQLGGVLRFGRNLQADYGPARMRPSLSGTSYFNSDDMVGDFGFYFFAGAQGRAIAHNVFLDGNTFRDSRDVDSEPLVADLVGGVSLFWGDDLKLDVQAIHRTKEFEGQDKASDYAGLNLTLGF